MQSIRLSYEESCKRLRPKFLDDGIIPPIPNHLPQADDEESLGLSFFRTFVGDGEDLSNLTLPRTFFGRSEIDHALFRNADLRASNYCRVNFASANLAKADLRGSWFKDCNFCGASTAGAVLTRDQRAKLSLSDQQCAEIAWTDDAGHEPAGG